MMENNIRRLNDTYYKLFDGKYEVINLIQDRLISLKYSEFKPNNPIVYSNYANVLKYACRWHLKGGTQDLKKLIDYAEMIIDQYEHEEAMDILEEAMDKDKGKYYDNYHTLYRAERGPF